MKILLTGATGYIGKRILPLLVEKGHHVICCARDAQRFNPPKSLLSKIEIIELDVLNSSSLEKIPSDIDVAYYLIHSMSSTTNYQELEKQSAINFRQAVENTGVSHVIYLSGIVNESELSEHLKSRKAVEDELSKGKYAFTCLRAGIIIGSGSASFEIMRDLVEKLPIMVAPKWLLTKCQPIAISDVLKILIGVLGKGEKLSGSFDIGGDEVFTYKEMLLRLAKVRKLGRKIFIVPVMTPRLSSYWLYFVTSTSYTLAVSLVDSMKVEVVCAENNLKEILGIQTISYDEAISRAFEKLDRNEIASSWKDSYSSSGTNFNISDFIKVPVHGCFQDRRTRPISSKEACLDKIWSIGGKNGWYYGTLLWQIRGLLDKIVGGVGLRRGRTNQETISAGDALDFWRVLYADKEEGRLLLFAEMKLPGDAWLEFQIIDNQLVQTATFRPMGVRGRLYWYAVLPFHGFIFNGLIRKLAQ